MVIIFTPYILIACVKIIENYEGFAKNIDIYSLLHAFVNR